MGSSWFYLHMHEHPLRWTWKGFFVYSVAVPAMRLHCVGYCCSMYMKDAGSGDDSTCLKVHTTGTAPCAGSIVYGLNSGDEKQMQAHFGQCPLASDMAFPGWVNTCMQKVASSPGSPLHAYANYCE